MTAKEFWRTVSVETRIDPAGGWDVQGHRPRRRARRPGAGAIRSLAGIGRRLCGLLDGVIAGSSLVSTTPVLDMRDFAWTQDLRDAWREILAEAIRAGAPLRLYSDGRAENVVRCPRTAALLRHVPGLVAARFSILPAGTHIAVRRGATKALITCHLGLVVPRDGDVRMRVEDRVLRWAEGETLVFDDSCAREQWNDSAGSRLVLVVRFRRPLRQPGRAIADLVLGILERSRHGA